MGTPEENVEALRQARQNLMIVRNKAKEELSKSSKKTNKKIYNDIYKGTGKAISITEIFIWADKQCMMDRARKDIT